MKRRSRPGPSPRIPRILGTSPALEAASKRIEAARRGRQQPTPANVADEGNPVRFSVTARAGRVHMEFDRPITLFGLSPDKARRVGQALIAAARAQDQAQDQAQEQAENEPSSEDSDKR